MRDDPNRANAATGAVCTKTAIYQSGCSCRSRTFRCKGEVFPCCLRCQSKVGWELVQELPVLDPAHTSSPSKDRGEGKGLVAVRRHQPPLGLAEETLFVAGSRNR
jgi:hypothetical protein